MEVGNGLFHNSDDDCDDSLEESILEDLDPQGDLEEQME